MLIMTAATAFAEGETPQDRSPVNISGRIYFQWYKTIENSDESESINGFELNRVYLTFDRALNSAFSVLVTLDAGNDNGNDERYQNFVKFAYGQFAGDLGFARATLRTGLIPIAVSALLDGVGDYRWLANNTIDRAKDLLYSNPAGDGQTIDTTADLGVGLTLAMGSMLSLDFQVTNGDGFKKTDESGGPSDDDDGKAYLAMITFRPIQHFYAAAYARYQTTLDNAYESDNYRAYTGITLMYATLAIKSGVSFVAARASSKDATAASDADPRLCNYLLGDVFVNMNLMTVIGSPLLLAGRVAVGQTSFDCDTFVGAQDGDKALVIIYAAGIGWQFNEYYRIMAYYEDRNSSSDDIPALDWRAHNRIFYLKSEIRF
jgi:hypothetical protein